MTVQASHTCYIKCSERNQDTCDIILEHAFVPD